jgi:hypothetical protein
MASLFGARRRRSPEDDGEDSDGSGSGSGRAKRRRLEPEGASPGGWLSTFVSGARRVISTVLFSSSEEQVSEDEEEEEEDSSEPSQGLLLNPLPRLDLLSRHPPPRVSVSFSQIPFANLWN